MSQKYRLYLKRVAGVQVQPSGRGKGARSAGGDSHPSYPPMIMPGHGMGAAQGLSMGSPMGSLSDQEQLKLQLQMQQMRNQQAIGAQPLYCKQEVCTVSVSSGGHRPVHLVHESVCSLLASEQDSRPGLQSAGSLGDVSLFQLCKNQAAVLTRAPCWRLVWSRLTLTDCRGQTTASCGVPAATVSAPCALDPTACVRLEGSTVAVWGVIGQPNDPERNCQICAAGNGGPPSRPAGSPGLMAMRSGSYDNSSLGLPNQV